MQSAQFQLHAEIEQAHWWFVARRQIIRRIVGEICPPRPHAGILDVGCGTGGNIAELAGDYRCVGRRYLVGGHRTGGETVSRCAIYMRHGAAGGDRLLPQIQLILLMDVLEHVADDLESVIAAWFWPPQPGTYFLITVPADPQALVGPRCGVWPFPPLRTGVDCSELWLDLPIRPVFMSHFNSRLYPLVKLKRSISRRHGKAGGLAGTDFRLPRPAGQSCFAANIRG